MKLENSVLKQGVNHLYNAVDDVAAENEALEKKNQYYEKTFGEINKEYIEKGVLTVIRTPEKTYAKKALAKYIQRYEAENKNDENNKACPQSSSKAK